MGARRHVLNGASDWAREEKANQQRDYAAQLQEQVRQKQAQQEQEKARRQQEEQEEMEILKREREHGGNRKHQSQPEETVPKSLLSVQSSQRTNLTTNMVKTESQKQEPSPLKFTSSVPSTDQVLQSTAEPVQRPAAPDVTVNYGPNLKTPAFSYTPSLFESLLREPGIGARSIAFYDDLVGLQRLAVELESAAKQRRTKAQNNYVKPNFLHQVETSTTPPTTISTAALCSSMDSSTKVKEDDNLQLDNNHTVLYPKSHSNLDAPLGESILLPLASPFLSSNSSNAKFCNSMGQPSESVDTKAKGALNNCSEMLKFTASGSC